MRLRTRPGARININKLCEPSEPRPFEMLPRARSGLWSALRLLPAVASEPQLNLAFISASSLDSSYPSSTEIVFSFTCLIL